MEYSSPIAILIYSMRSWQLGKAGKLTPQYVTSTIAQLQMISKDF
ncbi:MAG: hypothetical protein V7K61_16135 [Nostoc sp.]